MGLFNYGESSMQKLDRNILHHNFEVVYFFRTWYDTDDVLGLRNGDYNEKKDKIKRTVEDISAVAHLVKCTFIFYNTMDILN